MRVFSRVHAVFRASAAISRAIYGAVHPRLIFEGRFNVLSELALARTAEATNLKDVKTPFALTSLT